MVSVKSFLKLFAAVIVLGLSYAVNTIIDIYYVPTSSMIPAIMPGDLVFAKHVNDPSLIEIGDIVIAKYNTVSSSGKRYDLIIHRVIDIDRSRGLVYLKGDNSGEIQVVPINDVISIVVFGIPYVGYISLYLRDYLIYIIALLIIYILWSYR